MIKVHPRSKQQKIIALALVRIGIATQRKNEFLVDESIKAMDIKHLNRTFPIKRLLKMDD